MKNKSGRYWVTLKGCHLSTLKVERTSIVQSGGAPPPPHECSCSRLSVVFLSYRVGCGQALPLSAGGPAADLVETIYLKRIHVMPRKLVEMDAEIATR